MKTSQLSIIAVLLIVFGWIMLQAGKQSQLAAMHQAYSTCWTAHNEISGQSEQTCGRVQDATHTEFLCNQTNTACWLEVK